MHPLKIKCTMPSHVFKPGDVVECIDDSLTDADRKFSKLRPEDTPWLRKGKVYRITWTGGHSLVGNLVNIDQDPDWFIERHAWEAERFRHLNERGDEEVLRRIRTAGRKRDMVPA